MRLRVKAGAIAGLPQTTVEHSRHGTLTLGARDMHGAKLAMRITDSLERSLHPLELVNLAARLERIEPVDSFGELVHSQPEAYRLLIDGERISGEEQLMPIRRMQATIYFVKDWDAAIAFYRDVLGLKEVVNFPDRWALFNVPGGGNIALQPTDTSATNHVSIEVTSITDFVADLKAKGARVVEDICQQEHGETAMIEDPSGNLIALIDTSTSKFAHD